MKKIIITFLFFITISLVVKSQNNLSHFAGTWQLTTYNLVDIDNVQKPSLTKENCVWSAYIDNKNLLIIKEDGSFKHYNTNYPINAKIEINGNDLKIIYFDSNEKSSYIDFEFILSKNKLVLKRTDLKFKEEYTFIRKK